MSESFERFHPALTPQQVETILATSNVFGLWMGCKRPACRRSGACRGFTGTDAPHCVLRLIKCFRVVLDAVGALFPHRKPRRTGLGPQLDRIGKRMANLLERNLDVLERRADARAKREEEDEEEEEEEEI